MPEVSKRLHDVKETAATLSISTKSVRNLVKRGLLRPNRAVRKLLFSPDELDKFANS